MEMGLASLRFARLRLVHTLIVDANEGWNDEHRRRQFRSLR